MRYSFFAHISSAGRQAARREAHRDVLEGHVEAVDVGWGRHGDVAAGEVAGVRNRAVNVLRSSTDDLGAGAGLTCNRVASPEWELSNRQAARASQVSKCLGPNAHAKRTYIC